MFASLLLPLLAAAPILDDRPLPQESAPGDAALIIGVSNYAFIADVPYADRDARAFATWLSRGRGVPADRIKLLVDARAVKESIESAAAEVSGQVGPEGTLWVFFAGHGVPSADAADGLLAGADAQQTLASLQARSVSRNALVARLEGSRAGRVVVLIDACFSGKSRLGEPLIEGLRPMMPVSRAAKSARVLVLSAAQEDETSGPLDRVKQGLFSYFAIGGLRGWADLDKDGAVTAGELATYTRRGAASVLADGSRRQTPNVNADVGDARLDWTLASKTKEQGPDLAEFLDQGAQVHTTDLPPASLAAVPELSSKLKRGGAIQFRTTPEVLVAYDAAVAADQQGEEAPLVAAEKWEALYAIQEGNPYRADAIGRARQWRQFAERKVQLDAQREEDESRLKQVLPIERVSLEQKKEMLATYEALYGSRAAASLVSGLPGGAHRLALCDALNQAAIRSEVSIWMPFRGSTLERGTIRVDGRDAGGAPSVLQLRACAASLEVTDGRGETWRAPLVLSVGEAVQLRPSFSWSSNEKPLEALQAERQRMRARSADRFSNGRLATLVGAVLAVAAVGMHVASENNLASVRDGSLPTGSAIADAAGAANFWGTTRNLSGGVGLASVLTGIPLMLFNTDPGELEDPTPKPPAEPSEGR